MYYKKIEMMFKFKVYAVINNDIYMSGVCTGIMVELKRKMEK